MILTIMWVNLLLNGLRSDNTLTEETELLTQTINRIRAEALGNAADCITEDGNPMVAKAKILAMKRLYDSRS